MSTRQVKEKSSKPTESPEKNPHAVAMGKLGGKKGGLARAKKLTAKRRKQIAQQGAKARWGEKKEESAPGA
jgi:hypothetical protein